MQPQFLVWCLSRLIMQPQWVNYAAPVGYSAAPVGYFVAPEVNPATDGYYAAPVG